MNKLQNKIKSQFPIFNNGDLVYLDSAASSQKPYSVLKSINEAYSNHYANIHRGVYRLSQEATDMHEDAREIVKNFINANSVREIIFVRGATEAINLVASTVAGANIILESVLTSFNISTHIQQSDVIDRSIYKRYWGGIGFNNVGTINEFIEVVK